MALEEYRRKRDFKKTPEPPPSSASARDSKLSYLIQKHDATRLHYDFRLELDGVLLSWAVTKGPSINPADKRLAVRTEDHPLSYGTFEGTIPKGQYGGGTVMLWDTGSWEPVGDPHAGLKKGHLSFILHGSRLKGKWDLVRMHGDEKRENWLLIKGDDQEAARGKNGKFLQDQSISVARGRSMDEIASGAKSKQSKRSSHGSSNELEKLIRRYPEVQLATLTDVVPEGAGWLHEIKFDGYRLLGFVSGGECRLRTRNGQDWTERLPSLTQALQRLKVKAAVLDMEAVILNAQGKSDFQALQSALSDEANSEKIVAYVFDALNLDGRDLTKLPLIERKDQLEALLKGSKQEVLRYSGHVGGRGSEVLAQACKAGLEGIIAKVSDAPYVAGRQRTWLKIKCGQRQEFIILGYSDARKGERALGALYLGYRKNGTLKYAGKVGTGFTLKSAHELAERFEAMKVDKPLLTREETAPIGAREWRSIHWIDPTLLGEVAFTEWTQDNRIRHPSFQGLREDKDASEVKKETVSGSAKSPKSATAGSKAGAVVVNGITITHADRVISETGGVTKGELAEYYAAVAAYILPQVVRRPLSLLRCPSGIGGECFFQRNPGRGLGREVRTFDFTHRGRKYKYLYIENEKGLLELIQMGAIELHPWGATIDAIDHPDRMIFDLDPAAEVPFEAVKLAAEDLRRRLAGKGLKSVLKCTGGKGLHVTVPLDGTDSWATVKSFAAALAAEMVEAAPQAYVATMSKAKRKDKIFIDYFRNDYTATAISDYSVRALPGAPVATPVSWNELKSLKSAGQFTMKDVLKRCKGKRPKASEGQFRQSIPKNRART
jgi:bifunctional non-homologous end joining protein LigD